MPRCSMVYFTYIWMILGVNVDTYSIIPYIPYMEHMGIWDGEYGYNRIVPLAILVETGGMHYAQPGILGEKA